ncbi:MAG TPA: hypothetical protein VMZ31_00595 [Phycisphaerae bacterium]|nr:hypothetical protein [Phycisphaerae bacterium]
MDQVYLEERRGLSSAEQDIAKSLDKWVLTLSGGALTLSVTFLRDLVTPGEVKTAPLLFLGWLCLMGGVGFPLVGIWRSQRAFAKYREILDMEYENGGGEWHARARDAQARARESRFIERSTFLGMWGFLIGILLLGVFAYLNIR